MSILLFALALVAPVSPASDEGRRDSEERVTCSVGVHALDDAGRPRPARRVSASVAPAVVFRGKVSRQADESQAPPLVFDVYNPRGVRYQVLLATPLVITKERGGHRVERTSRVREAALAVAGSSIAWTSMFGKWRVEPRIEGADKPCGRPEYFTIRP
jgi:hypothetical protein